LKPLSEKAQKLLGFMKRQNAAAEDILRNVNQQDAGIAWNSERKARRSTASDVSEISDVSIKTEDYYPYKK
jgi:hypothetical protein